MICENMYIWFMNPIDKALLEVQEKHIEWFKQRPPLNPNLDAPHDLLENHYIFKGDEFCVNRNSDLPNYIIEDCVKALNKLS